ncbi:unnamed protein product, partial [marine sediment metagenome]
DKPLEIPSVSGSKNNEVQSQTAKRRDNQDCQQGLFRKLATPDTVEDVMDANS